MTNQEILQIAMRQSAEDIGCRAEDFLSDAPILVPFRLGAHARKYYKEPITCHFVSYRANVVAASVPETAALAEEYIRKFPFYHCFETPNMDWLSTRLLEKGHKVCFMAEYYLPDITRIPELSCPVETRLLGPEDFRELYVSEWSKDVLGVGAYDGGKLVGLAACSADCEDMWQIGIDVLPQARGRGIAPALTSRLAKEILARGKVPFYCSAWSNIRSARNAFRSGFLPAWAEMTVKPASIVDELNR